MNSEQRSYEAPGILKPSSLWRDKHFLKFWAAQSISQFGSQISFLAIPLIAVSLFGATPFQMGLLTAAGAAPILVFGLLAGAWVDRVPRRPILIGADIGRMFLLLGIPIASALSLLRMDLLYIVAFGVGTLSVFFGVAYQSFVPSLVAKSELVEANSKLEVSRAAAQVTGPGVAGLLVGTLSAPIAILVDAVSFLLSAILLISLGSREFTPIREEPSRSFLRDIGDGLSFVLKNPILRAIAATIGTAQFFGGFIVSLIVLYASSELGLNALAIGLLFAGGNIGLAIGAAGANTVSKKLGIGPTLLISPIIAASGTALIPIAKGPHTIVVPLLMMGLLLDRLGATIYSINQLSLRQAITPDEMLGRMSATMRVLILGALPLGALVGGALGSSIGLWPTLVVAAIGRLAPVLLMWLSPIRKFGPDLSLDTLERVSSSNSGSRRLS